MEFFHEDFGIALGYMPNSAKKGVLIGKNMVEIDHDSSAYADGRIRRTDDLIDAHNKQKTQRKLGLTKIQRSFVTALVMWDQKNNFSGATYPEILTEAKLTHSGRRWEEFNALIGSTMITSNNNKHIINYDILFKSYSEEFLEYPSIAVMRLKGEEETKIKIKLNKIIADFTDLKKELIISYCRLRTKFNNRDNYYDKKPYLDNPFFFYFICAAKILSNCENHYYNITTRDLDGINNMGDIELTEINIRKKITEIFQEKRSSSKDANMLCSFFEFNVAEQDIDFWWSTQKFIEDKNLSKIVPEFKVIVDDINLVILSELNLLFEKAQSSNISEMVSFSQSILSLISELTTAGEYYLAHRVRKDFNDARYLYMWSSADSRNDAILNIARDTSNTPTKVFMVKKHYDSLHSGFIIF